MRLLAVSVVLAMGCGDNEVPPAADPRPVVAEFSATLNRNLDLLFVVDDSGATAEAQFALAAGVPALVTRLELAIVGGLPSMHIGLVTSDLGTLTSTSPPAPPIGTLGAGGCAESGRGGVMTTGPVSDSVDGNFIKDLELAEGSRERNYSGELVDVLRDYVRVGSVGCGFEQPLASLRTALDGNPANAGFLRDDAVLAILLMMDEDDCSAKHPALFGPDTPGNPQSFRCTRFGVTCLDGGNTPDEMNIPGPKGRCGPNTSSSALLDDIVPFRDFLLGLKNDPRLVVVGTVIGDAEPFVVATGSAFPGGLVQSRLDLSCSVDGGNPAGVPGVRLKAFAEQFVHSTIGSVCQLDYESPLESFAQQIALAMGTPCVGATVADSNLTLDGLQPDCIVEDHVGDQTSTIPACETSNAPCWQLETDPTTCPLFDHLKLTVTRGEPVDPATVTQLRCTTI